MTESRLCAKNTRHFGLLNSRIVDCSAIHTGLRHLDGIIEDLSEPFLLVEGADEIRSLLRDLLTPEEIERFAARWLAMKLLAQGLRPVEVRRKTGISRTTIGRAHRVVRHGTGVVQKLVQRLQNQNSGPGISLQQR